MTAVQEALFPAGGDALITGPWRYWLTRTWNPDGPVMCWLMLNPSKADAGTDDPTVFRCRKRAMLRQWRGIPYGGIVIVNLFAWRATDPAGLFTGKGRGRQLRPEAVGPDNDRHIQERVLTAHTVVAAWGAHRFAAARAAEVLELVRGYPLSCLGITESGAPVHPLYIPYDTSLRPYPDAAAR